MLLPMSLEIYAELKKEDLDCDAQRLIQLTKEKLTEWMGEPDNDFWRYDFDEEELMPFAVEFRIAERCNTSEVIENL